MAAFDRIPSGIPEMDKVLDNIRLGDNVVWRVSDLEVFKAFVNPYVRQAVKDGRHVVYVRFAAHDSLIDDLTGVEVVQVELSHRFETFTVDIHNIIEQRGKDVFYVFDCLSELQTAWSTDLMMGNFFQVTCPFLFEMDTVAYFPLMRGKHSLKAVAKIRDTAQVFLDAYDDGTNIYVRPEKVWRRFSETMFLPQMYQPKDGTFRPILDGVQASQFYRALNRERWPGREQNSDAWDRFFDRTMEQFENGQDVSEEKSRMCRIMITRDERLRLLVRKYFKLEDYFDVRLRMVGTGLIGGKACGMLLARKIIERNCPDIAARLEPHDSFYVGSDVFYSYIVENHFWKMRIHQRRPEEYFSLAEPFAEKLRTGRFTKEMEDQFVNLLEYFGQDPIIVRSSSILEDGFGNAFAGKYESVFCANTGSIETRLAEFEDAVRQVYASTMSLSALTYRKDRGLDQRDEQMALLVQRVSGSYYDTVYMPCAAGVGYSYSPYRFLKDLDPEAGMLRLVMGLGTSAVDRTEGSYPRLVSLDKPEVVSAVSSAEKHRYSQRGVEYISSKTRKVEQALSNRIEPLLPAYMKKLLFEHDWDAERQFRERGSNREILFVSCAGLVKNKALMEDMRRMMAEIQRVYQYPVDIEFTINLAEDGTYVINLLQCRPLQVFKDDGETDMPETFSPDKVVLECDGASMGLSLTQRIDAVAYVDPVAYYEMPYVDKTRVAKAIGQINWHFKKSGRHLILMVPGRVGTSSPELGVPTTFSDIDGFDAVFEIADSRAGYSPELSYGSHIFQDLVEAKILYTAVFENEKTKIFDPEKFKDLPNRIAEVIQDTTHIEGVVSLFDTAQAGLNVYHDMSAQRLVLAFDA